MKFISSFIVPAFFAATAFATYDYDYEVNVGADGKLAFDPEYIYANPGDIVKFNFFPKNHSVTQSSFDEPCTPLHGGADSGFVPVPIDTVGDEPFYLQVVDESPVWFHCMQQAPKPHCQAGMVFAINPPDEHDPKSFAAFKANALAQPPKSDEPEYESWDHQIVVGPDGKLAYDPPSIQAEIGDTVTFVFMPKNHTVTQSSFDAPCQSLEDTTHGQVQGFKSGFMPVAADATEFPTFTITIENKDPIWGYCGQTGHCGKGMVFAINANENSDKNFWAFQHLAIATNGTN